MAKNVGNVSEITKIGLWMAQIWSINFWTNRQCRWGRMSDETVSAPHWIKTQRLTWRWWCIVHVSKPGPPLMTWHSRVSLSLTWHVLTRITDWSGDMADDRAKWLCWLMTWRFNPVQLQVVWWRSVECVGRVYARGQSWRRPCWRVQACSTSVLHRSFISGFIVFPYTMVCSKTRFENFDFWVWIKHPSFSRTSSITRC
jgi:hypothetical protein